MLNGMRTWLNSGSIRSANKVVEDSPRANSGVSNESWQSIERFYSEGGMSVVTIERTGAVAQQVRVDEETLTVELRDGRTISVPLTWYPRLLHATLEERNHWRFIGRGIGIHWPELDEDISIENLLSGRASSESQRSLQRWLEQRGQPQTIMTGQG
jgi:hypothetical protein